MSASRGTHRLLQVLQSHARSGRSWSEVLTRLTSGNVELSGLAARIRDGELRDLLSTTWCSLLRGQGYVDFETFHAVNLAVHLRIGQLLLGYQQRPAEWHSVAGAVAAVMPPPG